MPIGPINVEINVSLLRVLYSHPHTMNVFVTSLKHLISRPFIPSSRIMLLKEESKTDQYLVVGRDKSYFIKSHSKSNNKYK